MRWKDVLRAQLGIFILPVTSFIAVGTIPAFSGQTSGARKRGTRWTLPSNSSHFCFPIISVRTRRKFPTLSYAFTCKTRAVSYGTRRIHPKPEENSIFPKTCYDISEFPPHPPAGTSPEDGGPSGQSPRRDTRSAWCWGQMLQLRLLRSTHLLVLAVLANMLVHQPERFTPGSSLGSGRND